MASRLVLDKPKVKMFALETTARFVAKTAALVETAAKNEAPVRKPNENNRPGGRLRASIGSKLSKRTYVITARVGSRVRYAEVAHEGAKPHIIRPRKKRGLSFKWKKAPSWMVTKRGRYAGRVFLLRVNHPGMKGTSYLTNPLHRIATPLGYRVITNRTIS